MEFKSEFEVYKFIMDMETYIMESTPVPFTNKVMVDKNIIYDYLDTLRSRLPKELRACSKTKEQQKDEHKQPVDSNAVKDKEQGKNEIHKNEGSSGEQGKIAEVEQEARRIIAEAKRYGEQIRSEAEGIKKSSLAEQAKITGAEQEAQRIIAEAKRYGEQIRSEAEGIKKSSLA
ncbi:MAG: hypothetical protein ACOWWO_12560, partial [Peptococcaceae bacterium]